jgi:RNA polymerase I-specific transcription initiation factor RRN7
MEIAFTAVLYNLGKTVAHVLSLPLALHHSLAPNLVHLKDDDPDSHKYDDVPPELALLVAVLIVLKMVYGFDGRRRCVGGQAASKWMTGTKSLPIRLPRNGIDPACALPRMEDFLLVVKNMNEAHTKSKEGLFSASSEM